MPDTQNERKKPLSKRIEIVVDEAKGVMGDAKDGIKEVYHTSGADSIGDNIRDALDGVLSSRDNVVMVRLNTESLARVDDLIEAGLVNSRSEGVAFLVGEGIKSRADVFEKIAEKVDEIRKAKEELRDLLAETPAEATPSEGD